MIDKAWRRAGITAATSVFMLAGGVACAQEFSINQVLAPTYERGRNVSVLQRERPEYTAPGILAGGFTLRPRLEVGPGFDSNVYVTDSAEKSAAFLRLNPTIDVASNWSRHQLRLSTGARIKEMAKYSDESQRAWFVRSSGRLDIYGASYAGGAASVERLYQDRLTGDFPTTSARPIGYVQTQGSLQGVHAFDRVRVTAGVGVRKLGFSNTRTITGGTLDNSGRDNTATQVQARIDYAISPAIAVYISPSTTKTDYDNDTGVFAPTRDSKETKVMVGADFDLTALMRGEISVGYSNRDYRAAAFPVIKGPAVNATVEYFPTQLTTLTFQASRSVNDSIQSGAAGYFDTNGGVRIDHELRRNVILNGTMKFAELDFKGIDRKDNLFSLSSGVNYLMSPKLSWNGSITYQKRESSGSDARNNFKDLIAVVGIVFQR